LNNYFKESKVKIKIHDTEKEMAKASAKAAMNLMISEIEEKGSVTIVAATGASQFDFLASLTSTSKIDWNKVTMFHLDEYIGISEHHPASFRRYLKERLINKVNPGSYHLIQGDAADPIAEANRLNEIISQYSIDVAFVGVGENGHLAFNDPPADFKTKTPYLILPLDKKCRMQQVSEGWFKSIEEVPTEAISMSIQEILRAKNIICTVPGKRKAEAVHNCFKTSEVSPENPSSILKTHLGANVFLDRDSASALNSENHK
jgi:glucosamine-6-phosphate deaminase